MKYLLTALLITLGFAAAQPTTITYWDATGAQAELTQTLVDEFNASRDDIQINLVIQPQYVSAIDNAFRTGQAPDVFRAAGFDRAAAQGWLLPLEGVVDPALIEALRPFLKEGGLVQDGQVLGLPTALFTFRLIYNRDLFEQAGLDPNDPPETFSELVQYAQQIEQNTDAYGFSAAFQWGPTHDLFTAPMVLALNSTLSREGLFDSATGEYRLDAFADVINMYRELNESGAMLPGSASLPHVDQLRPLFAQGAVAMYIDNSNGIGSLVTATDQGVDWAAAPLPVADGETRAGDPIEGARPYSISSTTENVEAAAEVLEYLVGAEVTGRFQREGQLYAVLPDARTKAYFPDIEGFEDFLPAQETFYTAETPNALLNLQGATYSDTLNELVFTDADVDARLAELNERYSAAYRAGVEEGRIDPAVYEPGSGGQ